MRTRREVYNSREMAIDTELLEILACPICKEEVKVVPLTEERRTAVRDKYREKFRGEESVVEQGLQCVKCQRVYPIVSDIPVMLVQEAFDEAWGGRVILRSAATKDQPRCGDHLRHVGISWRAPRCALVDPSLR